MLRGGDQLIVVEPKRDGWQRIVVDPLTFAAYVPFDRDGGDLRIALGLKVDPIGTRATPHEIGFARLHEGS